MRRFLPLVLAAGLALTACQSVPKSIATDLAPNEYFQVAQQYSDRGNYKAARFYYDTFMQRYPDDASRIVEAQYEIGFLYYRMRDYAKSRELFVQLVDRYKQPASDTLPRWPLVLANKLINEIDQQAKPKAPTTTASTAQPAAPAAQTPSGDQPAGTQPPAAPAVQ